MAVITGESSVQPSISLEIMEFCLAFFSLALANVLENISMKAAMLLVLFGLCLNMFQIVTVQDKMTKVKNILPSNTKVTREMLAKGTYKI